MSETIITVEQIKVLKAEASAAGDMRQVEMCERALRGDAAAVRACAESIEAARAMGD